VTGTFRFAIALFLLFAGAGPGFAAAPVLNPGRQLLEQTQPQQALKPTQGAQPAAKEAQPFSNPNEQKFLIRHIVVSGVTRIPEKEIRRLVSPYENHSLGASDINSLLEILTRAYVKRGYITTRVYLPQQNIQTRVLKLQVAEGRLQSYSAKSICQSQLFTAFPARPGQIIELPALEQGMDQLERPRSVKAKSELMPGKIEGTSILSLDVAQTFPGHFDFGVDNLGNSITGAWQYSASGGWDNLLKLNDVWQASYQHSDHSDAVAGSVLVPFRWWTLTSSASYAFYSEPIAPDLNSDTESVTLSEQLEQLLYRTAHHKLAAAIGFDWTQDDRRVLADQLTPTRSASFLFSINDIWQMTNRAINLGLTYQEGFPIFGVHADPDTLRSFDPHAEFQLLKFTATMVDQSLKWLNWRSDFTGQYAFDGLLSDQELYLSDPYYLRGWNHTTIAADSAAVWRNEFDFHLGLEIGDPKTLPLATLRTLVPYIYDDLGYADSRQNHLHDLLGSAGAGLRFTYGRLTIDSYFAFAYGNKVSLISSPTFYVSGHLTAF
jgi:hemolysin activation/secretion protein